MAPRLDKLELTRRSIVMTADAWRRCRHPQSPVWAARDTVASTVTQWNIVAALNSFDPILTTQNSKFDMGTGNLAKIKVVEEKMIYNFRFGQKLIWSSDH